MDISKKKPSRRKRGGGGAKAAAGVDAVAGAPGQGEDFVRENWASLAAAVTAALIIAIVCMGYDGDTYAYYFTMRVAVFYPLVAVMVLLLAAALGPDVKSLRLDWLDALGLGFMGWQLVSGLVAPVRLLAFFDTYNRGSGVFLWLAVATLMLVGRRLVAGKWGRAVLIAGASLVLIIVGSAAFIQAVGGSIPWGGVSISGGRMTGTTGNPVNLAGIALMAVWLGVLALDSVRGAAAEWIRILAAVGSFFGLMAIILSVTRAAYLGLAVAVAVAGIYWLWGRRWRELGVLAAVVVLFIAGTLAYSPGGRNSSPLEEGTAVGEQEQVVETTDGATAQDAPAEAQDAPAEEGQGQGGGFGSRLLQLTASDQTRIAMWKSGLKGALERPLVGYGPGAYPLAYQLFMPADEMQSAPNTVSSDPHDAALLLAAGMGFPGALLALGLVLGAVVVLLRRRSIPSAVYGLGVMAYLVVSPVDMVTVVPLALVLGSALGPPGEEGKFSWRPSPGSFGRFLAPAVAVLAGLALAGSLYFGVQFYRADVAAYAAAREKSGAQAEKAAELFPYIPRYALQAGAPMWRVGSKQDRPELIQRGEELLRESLRINPSYTPAHVDLTRLYLDEGAVEKAVEVVRSGLEASPNHPVLQALWGYSAYQAVTRQENAPLARNIIRGLEEFGPTTADGWYWLSMAKRAEGDVRGAKEARDKAEELAPGWEEQQYVTRLQGGGG